MSEDDIMLFPTTKPLSSYNLVELLDWAKERKIDIPDDHKRWTEIYNLLLPYREVPLDISLMDNHDLELCCRFRRINIPQSIKSLEMRRKWVEGVLIERSRGYIVPSPSMIIPIDRISPVFFKGDNWLDHLSIHGWAIIRNVIPVSIFRHKILSLLGFSKAPPTMSPHILSKTTHSSVLWDLRINLSSYFTTFYQTNELVSSYEEMVYLPKSKGDITMRLMVGHPRNDPTDVIRGILYLSDSTKKGSGLVYGVTENYEEFYNRYLDDHPSEGYLPSFFNLTDYRVSELSFNKIVARAGDLVIFKTRLPYGILKTGETKEWYLPISFQPRKNLNKVDQKRHTKDFRHHRSTNEWTYGKWYQRGNITTPVDPPNYSIIKNYV